MIRSRGIFCFEPIGITWRRRIGPEFAGDLPRHLVSSLFYRQYGFLLTATTSPSTELVSLLFSSFSSCPGRTVPCVSIRFPSQASPPVNQKSCPLSPSYAQFSPVFVSLTDPTRSCGPSHALKFGRIFLYVDFRVGPLFLYSLFWSDLPPFLGDRHRLTGFPLLFERAFFCIAIPLFNHLFFLLKSPSSLPLGVIAVTFDQGPSHVIRLFSADPEC